MAIPIIWADPALDDLTEIAQYIEGQSPANAGMVVRRIVEAVERLANFPRSGRTVPETADSTLREVIVEGFRVMYAHTDHVEVIAVIRDRRRITRKFLLERFRRRSG